MHMWTFLTIISSWFYTITAFPLLSLSQSPSASTKLSPCHGKLTVVNMCMSNAMNMDVTSFFGGWPPACPHVGTPPGTGHHFSMSTACIGDMASPSVNMQRLTDTHAQIYIYMYALVHRQTPNCHAPALSVLPLFSDLSQCVLHKNKRGE